MGIKDLKQYDINIRKSYTIWCKMQGRTGLHGKLWMSVALLFLSCTIVHSSGIKKEDEVYQIATAQELNEFVCIVAEEDNTANAVLTADIDFSAYDGMIGQSEQRYTGTFDGCCHKITVDYDSPGNYLALFQFIGSGGEVKNLQVTGRLHSHEQYAAGLVADMQGGTISNCLVSVDIISDYTGDCTYGGISGFTTSTSLIRNCVYAGSIKAPLGKRVGGLVGWVDDPGTRIENSIAICHAELGTDENSNSVVRSHDRSYVKLHNVFYVNNIKSGFDGAQKVNFEDLQNGRIFYQVLGNEIYSAEQQLDQYEQDLKAVNVKLRLIGIIALLLALLLISAILLYRFRRRQTLLLFQKLLVEHELWEGQQQRILEFKVQQTEEATDIIQAEKVEDEEEENTIEEEEQPGDNTETELQEETISPDEETPAATNKEANQLELRRLYQLAQKGMAENHYYTDANLDVRKLALLIGTNRSTLSRAINRFSDGKNFNTWLAEYRLNHAISLMDNTQELLTLEDVATHSGFSSRSTFYRQFKTFTGLTPKQYLRSKFLRSSRGSGAGGILTFDK